MKKAILLWLVTTATALSQPLYAFVNLAGQPGGAGNADGTGIAARFNNPSGVAVDSAGNVFVADTQNHTIRMITLAGVVTTIAGSAGQSGSSDGTNGGALFYAPTGLAVDAAGNVFVADYAASTIRRITPSGTNWVVTTLAGVPFVTGSSNGSGSTASFSSPFGVAVDGVGAVYVADTGNQLIRKISPGGMVTTIAGHAGVSGNANGAGADATFDSPQGVAVDSHANVFVADTGNASVRVISPGGNVSTGLTTYNSPVSLALGPLGDIYVADTGSSNLWKNSSVFLPGLNQPMGVAVDRMGNVYVADTVNDAIRKITPGGFSTVLAGSSSQPGAVNGIGSAASFSNPESLAIDAANNVYVADTYNQTIREITPAGVVTTLAGTPGVTGSTDAGLFNGPSGIAVDSSGNVFVADNINRVIRKFTPGGPETTFVTGLSAPQGLAADTNGNVYLVDNYGRAPSSSILVTEFSPAGSPAYSINLNTLVTNSPLVASQGAGCAVDNWGNAYVAFLGLGSSFWIAKISPTGVPTNLVSGFSSPTGLAVDSSTNLFIGDTGNNCIRLVLHSGGVYTIAGYFGVSGSADGTNTAARFSAPAGVALDRAGNVYVADQNNQTIRKITPVGNNWVVTTIAGSVGNRGSVNGTNGAARFNSPNYIAVDSATNLYVTELGNQLVRKLTPVGADWVVTTLAGAPGQKGNVVGGLFAYPSDVAVDPAGNVYVADTDNHAIRQINQAGIVTTIAGSAGQIGASDGAGSAARFYFPSGIAADNTYNVYVADTYNHTIRKIFGGVVSTLAGSAGYNGSADGAGSAASFWAPTGVAVDAAANVYVADTFNNTVRQITAAGVVTTLAGSAGQVGSADGIGSAARFNQPSRVAVDGQGNIYVADTYNQTIRRITPTVVLGSTNWVVTTVGGTPGVIGGGLVDGLGGVGPGAEFDFPMGAAVDNGGTVYVADTGNNRISVDSIFRNSFPGPRFGLPSITGNLFQVPLTNATPGLSVVVQSSSDMQTWFPILTNSSALIRVSQPITDASSPMFFRAYLSH